MKLTDLMLFPGKRDKRAISTPNDVMAIFRKELEYFFDKTFSTFSESPDISLNVKNEQDQLTITAEVPGVNEEDISITLTGNILNIKAEKKQEKEDDESNYYMRECSFGTTSRSLQLPFQVDQKNIQVELENGVLTIKVPKPKEVQEQARKIPIYRKK